MLHKCWSFHPAQTRSLPCQVDVPCQDEMREGGRMGWLGLTKSQAPNRIQFRLLKILDSFWYKRCTWKRRHPWVSYAWRRPSFQWASQKSGWSAVTTEPFAGPQPMSQSPATIRHSPPMSSTRTANKAGDFRGSLSRPALSTVLNEPKPTSSFTHSHTCFFYLRVYTLVLLVLYTTLVAVLSIFVFLRL